MNNPRRRHHSKLLSYELIHLGLGSAETCDVLVTEACCEEVVALSEAWKRFEDF
jgi:hypothetical protein